MKSIILLALVLIAANSYTLWDNWHNVPTTWSSTGSHNTYGLSGYSRNGFPNFHPTAEQFSDTSAIYTQYLYWQTSDPSVIILCSPKYYLYSQSLCKVDPYFQGSLPQSCIPNYFNFEGKDNVCTSTSPGYGQNGVVCCYDNGVIGNPAFHKDINSVDPYSTPLY